MKIDLHCHTRRIKTGDGDGREVTPDLFREKVLEADVKIIAITNHNTFDYEQYCALKEKIADDCLLWPGVEIDIKDMASKWHLIVVVNPEQASFFKEKVDLLFSGDNLETCTHTLDEVCESFKECDAIYISHFHKKPSISEADMEKLISLVGDTSRVFNETQDHRSMGVFANYDYNTLVGSDVKNWKEYEKCSFAELRLPIENFTQFCLLAKRDASVVDSLINKKTPITVLASPHESVKIGLKLYPDINIIFGQKGTGKTEILTSIYNKMLEQGIRCEKSVASERADEFNTLLSIQDMQRDLTIVGRDSCEAQFQLLKEWNDNNPTVFSKYLEWYATKDNNSNKLRMKITNAQEIQFNKPEKYDLHISESQAISAIISDLRRIAIEDYLSPEECKNLQRLISEISQKIFTCRRNDITEETAVRLINYSINKIKEIADRNTDSVSKPSTTGYRDFANARLRLRAAIGCILKNLEATEKNERKVIGELEDKGTIYINSKYRMLCDASKTSEFTKGIRTLREVKQKIQLVNSHILDSDLAPILGDLVAMCEENGINSVIFFLGRSKQVVTSDSQEYKPSNGEKGILLLQRVLSRDADAYFLDEPELGMGNSFIDTNIRPVISNLGKRRKYVVVATHNANLAVRTLPYMSIYRTHQNGVYKTYVGNPFNDKLVNLEDPSDVLSWTDESMHSLEGSREAFYERRDIYESNS